MKYYDHTKTIKLRKTIIQYVNRVDGTFVWNYQIKWVKTQITECYYDRNDNTNKDVKSFVYKSIINNKVYTEQEFKDEFVEYISRADELVEETKKYKSSGVGSKPFINEIIVPNHNGRIYNTTNSTVGKSYAKHKGMQLISTYDIVADPGFSSAKLTYDQFKGHERAEEWIRKNL